jgi:polyphosphate glucokinase
MLARCARSDAHASSRAAYPAPDMSTQDLATKSTVAEAATSRISSAPAAATSKAVPLEGVALGIDVGGTGVKGAMVDLATAELVSPRIRENTPQPSEPAAVIEAVASVVNQVLAAYGPVQGLAVGCGLPGAIKHGHMKTAANLDKGWVDYDATAEISAKLDTAVHVINDADAAGMAELAYGEAKNQPGTTILLTLGTGIGSALISEGRLVPNTEFGHLLMHDQASETLVSGVARERRGLKWKEWAGEFNEYLAMLEFFLWPDRIILGGGVSKRSDKYWKYLKTNADLVKARYLNTSGIIGAAYAAGLATHQAAEDAKAAKLSQSRRPAKRPAPAGWSSSTMI